MQMVMVSDEIHIQIFANWPMSQAKRLTRDSKKNPEYRVVAAIRRDISQWHVALANWQRFGFEFHLRSSPSALAGI